MLTSHRLLRGRQNVHNRFKSGIFSENLQNQKPQTYGKRDLLDLARTGKASEHKVSDRKQFKILTPKLILQILLIALAQVKAGNTSYNLRNKI